MFAVEKQLDVNSFLTKFIWNQINEIRCDYSTECVVSLQTKVTAQLGICRVFAV